MVCETARDILREGMRFGDELCKRFEARFGAE